MIKRNDRKKVAVFGAGQAGRMMEKMKKANIDFNDYLDSMKQLNKMGANIAVTYPKSTIIGKTPLHGTDVTATDLRCGAGLVVAGLLADGITTIHDIYHIDRGYENLDGKLKDIGAKIWREYID